MLLLVNESVKLNKDSTLWMNWKRMTLADQLVYFRLPMKATFVCLMLSHGYTRMFLTNQLQFSLCRLYYSILAQY